MHLSGSVLLSNLSANDTSFLPVINGNASVNLSIGNSTAVVARHFINTSSDGSFKLRSDNFPAGIQIKAPVADGYYNFTAAYRDPNNDQWTAGGTLRVFSTSIDYVSISPAAARYYAGDAVLITLGALREVGDKKVALANISINGSMRYTNRTTISTFSCTTGNDGICATSVTSPSKTGTYLLEANNFLSTSSFVVVPFEAFVYVKDSTGSSFKEILKANEVATIETKVLFNGTSPSGDFVFNGTIIDSNSNVVANITSTNLNSNNSYTNRFSFTVSNSFTNGVYYASVTVYKTGGGSVAASTSFQVRSWTLIATKASKDSGFEYEYTAFANKNVSFEVFPKESQNGTVITGLNNTQFNVTLTGKTGDIVAVGNASWNASCSSSGCYTFGLVMPPAAGRYVLAAALNYSNEVQTVHRIISVTATSLSATPTSQDGLLKEVFGTTEFIYISLTAKNQTAVVNISDVLIESVTYENGIKSNFTDISSWSNVNSSNSALEWAWNASAQRLKLDAPKAGGDYLINVFASNRSVAASTKFTLNPYTVCSAAKSTAGSVDSSNNFYVWQYKTSDTVYFEIKISQAQNNLGRAKAENSTFSSSYYGMGGACNLDTTTSQAITNATLQVLSVVNLLNGAAASINTSASVCSADDNSGAYTCTVKPLTKWNGGRYAVKMQVTGPDGETRDKADSIFEAKAFYIWAYTNSWTNKPASNISFNVQMYEAGTNWWSNYGSNGGLTGDVTIEKVEYNGKDGEWLFPPIDIGYNTTGLNSSNITSGRGAFTLQTSKLLKGQWQPGYYVATIKGTNTATGESDYGSAWFGIKQWDAYSTPVEPSGSAYAYKNSFSTKENVTLFIRLTNAGDYSDGGNTNLAGGGNVVVGVKKLQYYTTWPPTELNTSAYTAGRINVSTSSPWYYSANPGTHSKYVMNISPTSGRWNSGYYNVILDVNGTETGYGWFNVVSFNVNTQPTNSSGTYTYTSKGNAPVYFNVTTTKNQKAGYGYYGASDYINTTVKDIVLRTWLETTWQTVEYNYPEDLNMSPLQVNGTVLLMVNKTGNWPGGYYWGEITLQDSENSTATGYMWFSVRSFRVETSTVNYNIDSTSNVSVNLNIRQPDWSNNNLVFGNYSVTRVFEDRWTGSGRSKTAYTTYFPATTSWFNATTILNVSPSGSWSSANNGYHSLTVEVRDNNDNTTQTGWVSFRSIPFVVTLGSVANQYSFPQTSNATVQASITKAINGAATAANLSRVFESTYPTQTTYDFAIGNCTSTNSATCLVNGTQNVTLIAPSGGWGSGYHYLYLELVSTDGTNKLQADNNVWFNAVQAYDGSFNNYNESGQWKYYFGFAENLTVGINVRNTNYVPQNVNITKVEMSEDGDNCSYEGCKNYTSYTYLVNGSGGNEMRGNATIRIPNSGSNNWKRGQHSIKATIQGSAGSAVIKTGYVWVKDIAAPDVTIVSPQYGQVINATSFLFNATTTKDSKCSVSLLNYDQFSMSYCWNNTATECNSTRFNGSTDYNRYVKYPPYGSMNTGGKVHYYNFSTTDTPKQDYGIVVWCNDADWNYASAKTAFTLNVSQTPVPVTVNLTNPVNNAVTNASTITFQHNITGSAASTINCTTYLNISNTWRANTSNTATIGNLTNTTATANISVTGFNNGTYIWNTYCYQTTNLTNAAWATANFTLTATNITPTTPTHINVTLLTPANGSTVNSSTVNYLGNISGVFSADCDLYTNKTGAWALTNDGPVVYPTNGAPFVDNIPNSNYIWNIYCVNSTNSNDTDWGDANFTFTVNNLTTYVPVAVNLSKPANTFVMNSSPVTFTYNVSGPSSINCSLWSNSTGAWKANITNSSAASGQQTPAHNFVNGYYIWNAQCTDTTNSTNYAWGSSFNWSITVTNVTTASTVITVNLSSPANASTVSSTPSFIYNASGVSSLNCTLWGNFTGSWAANATNNSVNTGLIQGGSVNVSSGIYIWNAKCAQSTDSAVFGWGLYNWTFTR